MGVLAVAGLSVILLGGADPSAALSAERQRAGELCRVFREIGELPPCAAPDGCRAKERLDDVLGPRRGPRWAAGDTAPFAPGGFVAASAGRETAAGAGRTRTAPLDGDLLAFARVLCPARGAASDGG